MKFIVEALREDTTEIVKKNPETLRQITTLNAREHASIVQGTMEHKEADDSIVFFTRMGTSIKTIMKVEVAYGEAMISMVKENPYRPIEEVDGIGFKTADKLMKELAFTEDHPYRIKTVVLSRVLDLCVASGGTYTTLEQIQKRFCKESDASVGIIPYLEELGLSRLIMIEDGRIYHHTQYGAQNGIASFLVGFPHRESEEGVSLDVEDIGIMEQKLHIRYENKQEEAIAVFFKEPFLILTGKPGTGRMTIVKGILDLCQRYYPSDTIALCAPTGRATERLSKLSSTAATTIHSLLRWDLETNAFLVNGKDPIQADLLIINEFSIADQWLFYHLLRAYRMTKRIIVIGDEDQLPSVDCRCVLRDLIESAYFPLVRLDKIFRQSEGSDVAALTHQVQGGSADILDHIEDIAFFPCQNYEVRDLILNVVPNALGKGCDPKEIQALAPMHGGIAGIDALNNALQKMIDPSDSYRKELRVDYRLFHEHDKILQLRNQSEDEIYNRGIGEVTEISYRDDGVHQKNYIAADFDGVLVEYSGEQIYNVTHAYATSIHRAQGSEYAIVIMPIIKDYHYMLQKRLIYANASRAERGLVLLGDKEVFLHALRVEDRHVCRGTLREKIEEMMR